MIKGLIKLALAFMVGYALFKFVPPYWSFTQFKWEVKERAVGWREHDDSAVIQEVLAIADEHGVPLTFQNVRLRREPDHLFVNAGYTREIEFLPGYKRRVTFEADVDAWTLRPPVKKP